jgi:hypothetical protein
MAATQRLESLAAALDRLIEYFNARKLDLPDGLFDRKTQFVINGAPFETLLGQPPNDPLVLMLARGPAGFRFTTKTLQHAMPDAKLERGEVKEDPGGVAVELWLSGTLRGSGEPVNSVVSVTLRLAAAGHVEIAEATVVPAVLDQLRQARLRP